MYLVSSKMTLMTTNTEIKLYFVDCNYEIKKGRFMWFGRTKIGVKQFFIVFL